MFLQFNGQCIRMAMYVNKHKPPQRKEYIKSTLDSVFNVRPSTSPDKRSI